MVLGWESVLKLAAVGALVMMALSTVLFFIFENIDLKFIHVLIDIDKTLVSKKTIIFCRKL